MSDLTPYLCVADSRAAIDWYGKVFQATVQGEPYIIGDGRVGHVELKIGESLLMMADPFPEVDVEPPDPANGSAVSLHLQVPDCDAMFRRAVEAGCEVRMPLEDMFWGDRYGQLRDPFGVTWAMVAPNR